MAKAWYVNGPKRKSRKRRSAAQKRAFRKMIAALHAKRKGKKRRRKHAAPKVTKRRRKRRARVVHARKRAAAKRVHRKRRRVAHGKARRKMARKVHRARKHRRKGSRRRRGMVTFRSSVTMRRNPGAFLSNALGLVKSAGPGAAIGAVADLYGIEPLMARFNVPRAVQPVVKVAVGLGLAAAVDRFAPKYKRHAEAAAIGLMAIAAKEAIGRLAGHPKSKIEDVADYYKGLNALVEVPQSFGVLGEGSIDEALAKVQAEQFSGWPEVYV